MIDCKSRDAVKSWSDFILTNYRKIIIEFSLKMLMKHVSYAIDVYQITLNFYFINLKHKYLLNLGKQSKILIALI